MINLSLTDPEHDLRPRLTVMGIGGAGGNAINNMIRCNLEGCDFIGANTDSQALSLSLAPRKIQLGVNLSRGLGAGSKPEVGRAAAEEQIADIMAMLEGSDMLFVTAGMGGGTGTGAAPVIARAARESGILTVGVVTKPFHFEGASRMRHAEAGIAELQQYVDTLIIIPNQNLFRIANERTTFAEAFRMADEVLHSGVRGITDLMVMPGFMNLDFADVRTVMGEMGKAMMGTGEADGDNRAIRAAEAAISNPLLDDVSMKGARGVLINITGGMDMTLFEVDQAANRIREEVDPDAQIKVGSTLGEDMEGRIRVSVIATGIDAESCTQPVKTSGSFSTRISPKAEPLAEEKPTPVAEQPTTQRLIVPQTDAAPKSYFVMPQSVTPQTASTPSMPPQFREENVASSELPAAPAASSAPKPAVKTETSPANRAPKYYGGYRPPVTGSATSPAVQRPSILQPQVAGGNGGTTSSVQTSAPISAQSPDVRMTQLTASPQTEADQRRQRRTESLFTRITGFGLVRPSAQHNEDGYEGDYIDDADFDTTPTAQSTTPRTGKAAGESEDMLEIPAFLRRQNNH